MCKRTLKSLLVRIIRACIARFATEIPATETSVSLHPSCPKKRPPQNNTVGATLMAAAVNSRLCLVSCRLVLNWIKTFCCTCEAGTISQSVHLKKSSLYKFMSRLQYKNGIKHTWQLLVIRLKS